MLGDENRDKELLRNQFLAIMLMTILIIGWSYFFMPTYVPQPVAPDETTLFPEDTEPSERRSDSITRVAEEADTPLAHILPPQVTETALLEVEEPIILTNGKTELHFTALGGRLREARILLREDGTDTVQLVPEQTHLGLEAAYPLGLIFTEDFLSNALDRRIWSYTLGDDGISVVFSIEIPELARIEKTFRLADRPLVLDVEVAYTNLESRPRLLGLDTREPAYSLYWAPNVSSGDADRGVKQEVMWKRDGVLSHYPTANLSGPSEGSIYSERVLSPEFVAIKSAFFAVAMKPDFPEAHAWVTGTPDYFHVGVGVPRMDILPGETDIRSFQVYLGPTQLDALRLAWDGLDSVLQFFTTFGFMDWFAKLLLGLLNWFYNSAIANYGLAIIFLTIVVRTVMFPLTYKSMISMKKMQKLAPEMEKIKKEVGEDPQEMQKRMMALYKERNVNPLGGCLPLLLQMPIFIALYRMLWSAFELRRAPFILWIEDLSEPDRLFDLPFSIPVPFAQTPLDSFNLLPILMGLAMVASMKLMPATTVQSPQQKMIMTLMPILFSVICYNMAAGLNLYILTSTLLGIAQNFVVHRIDIDVNVDKTKKTTKRPRNFYAAAQAKKREIAKEAKTMRKKPSSK